MRPMAINFYDIAYGFGVGISAPFWIVRSKSRKKVLGAFSQRMGQFIARKGDAPTVMIHAVSVGELNATRGLIDELKKRHPSLHFVVSTTTQTGYERGQQLYGSREDVTLIHYPLDFSAAIARVLDGLRPMLVILMELELWPNFMAACERRSIPVVLANGRITEPSFKKYKIASLVTRRMFRRLAWAGAQEEVYAVRFIELGADPAKVTITGTMKFDTAPRPGPIAGADELSREMGIGHPLWVCGSTGPGEEEIVLDCYRELLKDFPDLQLAIIPRKPERFDEVAQMIEQKSFPCLRRTSKTTGPAGAVLLGDTMGELRKFYALADVVFVGRTLVDLGAKQHGSDMIEPAALGKPTVVGPFTGNFAEVMNAFQKAQAIQTVTTVAELTLKVTHLLQDTAAASAMGARACEVVNDQRGATLRTLDHIEPILQKRLPPSP